MFGESVVIKRTVASTDEYGDEVYEGTVSDTTVDGCAVAPRYARENEDNRQAVITGLTIYFPPGTEILANDRLVVRGDTYEIEGDPGAWVSPFTGTDRGVEVAVTRTTG